jgi:hypothetical protein
MLNHILRYLNSTLAEWFEGCPFQNLTQFLSSHIQWVDLLALLGPGQPSLF